MSTPKTLESEIANAIAVANDTAEELLLTGHVRLSGAVHLVRQALRLMAHHAWAEKPQPKIVPFAPEKEQTG